jgi:hypothetical protein
MMPTEKDLLEHYVAGKVARRKSTGAGDGVRTRDINLGKVALYQLSYSRSNLGGQFTFSYHFVAKSIHVLVTRQFTEALWRVGCQSALVTAVL